MSAGQKGGTGAMVELEDEKVRKNDILRNRDKAQRLLGQGLDGRSVRITAQSAIDSLQREGESNEQST